MDNFWFKFFTLLFTGITAGMVIVNAIKDSRIKKKERRMAVELSEKRRMQNDLMNILRKFLIWVEDAMWKPMKTTNKR